MSYGFGILNREVDERSVVAVGRGGEAARCGTKLVDGPDPDDEL